MKLSTCCRPRFTAAGLCALLLTSLALPSWALIEPSASQRETMVEMIEQLEQRHYAKHRYDDAMSSSHLDSYIDSLDGAKMFFVSADIAEFEQYRNAMDDQLHEGNLEAGFAIFNRFQQRLEERLDQVVTRLPDLVATMDFSVDETIPLEVDDWDWAASQQELDDRWRKRLKNEVLSLKLADKPADEIAPTLEKRYSSQLKRIRQYNNQDVFQIYANSLTELYDPHTNYLSPRRSENFNINMSLSLEGIGAVLQQEDEYTKVARLVAKGPADKQGELQPSDRIVAVGQGADGELQDVIGWRLDEVVELIRGPKDSTVRLEIIPASSKTDEHKVVTIVRNTVKLEEQAAQKKILEIPAGGDNVKVGVIELPAFYIDFEAMRRGMDPSEIHHLSRIDRWFLAEFAEIVAAEQSLDGRFLSAVSQDNILANNFYPLETLMRETVHAIRALSARPARARRRSSASSPVSSPTRARTRGCWRRRSRSGPTPGASRRSKTCSRRRSRWGR